MTSSFSVSPRQRPIASRRVALVLTVCISDLLLTGLIFGWAPLLLLLKEEGQYHELCSDPSESPCVAQENRLNLIFAVASVAMNAGGLPIGMFLDRMGSRVTIAMAALIEVSGLSMLALADSKKFDVFVEGYVLIALGGCLTMMSSYPASFLIPQYQTAILAAISCLFDGSSVIFLVLYAAHKQFGWSRRQLFLGLAVTASVVYLVLIFLWGLNNKTSGPKDSKPIINSNDAFVSAPQQERLLITGNANDTVYGSVEDMEISLRQISANDDDAAFPLVDIAITKQIKSFEFAYVVLYGAVHVLRATVYIGTTNKLLDNFGDVDYDFFYTKVFSVVMPMGFVFVPLIDYVVESHGLSKALQFTNIIGVLYNILELVPSLPMQCAVFLLFTAYRAFLYAIISAFTAKTFGLQNMGSLMGIIFSICSVISLAEYPAVYITNSFFGGDLTLLNLLSLLTCVLMIPLTLYLRKYEHEREQQRRAEIAQQSGIAQGERQRETYSSLMDTPVFGVSYLRSPSGTAPPKDLFSPEISNEHGYISMRSISCISKIKPCMSKYKQFCTVKLRMAHYISYSLLDSTLLLG
ncbi:hypothetical protein PsorP6_008256 [Peronosclerospora sorghi]|uniref:Uncharacterized protein n=1 Tax=Peronosclerospora sorghi TaxID=230839 RepID=A0ACC0W6Z5_9STRA|nr:hypothetical protein PsorP6_008256 [Peronosclerospora sorghi]